ncbi:hypothetical protein I7I51_06752 [Histoplasma capsulatum]|uniref:Uncharacterized protein n=1 Tax=Ajellomyces capsulatus TaxID=5037 RepID=A0A8A1MIL3_AJECA|nr:hypothetical protein I7I51_06752 [Histoplasma capsulatum]
MLWGTFRCQRFQFTKGLSKTSKYSGRPADKSWDRSGIIWRKAFDHAHAESLTSIIRERRVSSSMERQSYCCFALNHLFRVETRAQWPSPSPRPFCQLDEIESCTVHSTIPVYYGEPPFLSSASFSSS